LTHNNNNTHRTHAHRQELGALAEEDYKRILGELMDLEKELENEIMLGTLPWTLLVAVAAAVGWGCWTPPDLRGLVAQSYWARTRRTRRAPYWR
jgi:hypothetical protein